MPARRLLLMIACAAAAASCEIPFELDKVSEPAIYVQYIADAGKQNGMIVSYAEPAFGTLSTQKYPFAAEDVKLMVGGKQAEVVEDTEASSWNGHMLKLSAVPSPGDEIELTVKGRGIQDAVARTVVPKPPVLSSVTMTKQATDSSNIFKVSLKLDHAVREGERYGLKASSKFTYIVLSGKGTPTAPESVRIDTTITVSYFMPGQVATTADLNSLDLDAYASIAYQDGFFGDGLFSGEIMTLIADRQFSGDTYSFYVNAMDSFSGDIFDLVNTNDFPDFEYPDEPYGPEGPEIPDYPDTPDFWIVLQDSQEYRFELFRLSAEFYNYAKAQYLGTFNMLSNFGVTPPNFTYSNIHGGLGLVGGIASVCTEWIPAPQ